MILLQPCDFTPTLWFYSNLVILLQPWDFTPTMWFYCNPVIYYNPGILLSDFTQTLRYYSKPWDFTQTLKFYTSARISLKINPGGLLQPENFTPTWKF